ARLHPAAAGLPVARVRCRRRHHLDAGNERPNRLGRHVFFFGALRSRCCHQPTRNRARATTSAINTHSTTAWSIHEPYGGLPGRIFRSGTMANSIAPYHVVIGGKNEVLPNATGMATHNANAGSAIRTRMMPRSKISGPFDRFNVMITLSRESGLGSSGSCTRV